MNCFWRGILALTVVATGIATVTDYGDIRIECGNDTLGVTWTVGPDVEYTRVFLGSCSTNDFTELANGSVEIAFRVRLIACRLKRQITAKWVTYSTRLNYKPLPKPQPAVLSVPVECVYRRTLGMFPGFLDPSFAATAAHGSLLFFMGIANGDFSGPALSSTFYLGSLIPIWAAVDQQNHLPLLLLLDECVATTSAEPDPFGPVYPIIANEGCLLDSKFGSSRFLPRRRSSELRLNLQAFRFAAGQEVYLHCRLVAWDPERLDKRRKACQYNRKVEGWELLDDPSQSSLCSCCDSHCTYKERRSTDSGVQGVTHKATLGPLTIIDGTGERPHSGPGKRPEL